MCMIYYGGTSHFGTSFIKRFLFLGSHNGISDIGH